VIHLYGAFDRAIDEILGGRVLPFDQTAAETATVIAAKQRQIGRPVEIRDVQIAGIAAARKQRSRPITLVILKNLGIILVVTVRSRPSCRPASVGAGKHWCKRQC
jgi:hypothetical protein